MNNYQLYRTNTKLGGQVSWNLVLEDADQQNLSVRYFDLTPISPNINYRYGQNTDCIYYSHQENLRTLYNEIKGQFYDAAIDPRLTTLYPIIDSKEKTYDNSLDLGCSRISLQRYGKQLQVFCPLWLEDFMEDDTLSFVISLYRYTKERVDGELVDIENVISSKRLDLKLLGNNSYHDQFVSYFKRYLHDIIVDDIIGDNVMNINITEKFASVHGLDIITGKLATKDISNLVPNLFERERPLMETDFMLIDNFHTSTIVAKQLFNFNLVFDIADLVSSVMNNMIRDNEFFIKVDVYKNYIPGGKNVPLEKRSFNNNYSSINRTSENYTFEDSEHDFLYFGDVLSYLQDDKCIDNIRDNKLAPDICHWTLSDNTNYIFNVYPGFGNVYDMFYKDSPNYWEVNTKKYPNTLNWINNFNLTANRQENRGIDTVNNLIISSPGFTEFNVSKSFVKDTRVDIESVVNTDSDDSEETYQNEYLASYITEYETITKICNSLDSNNMHDYIFIVPNDSDGIHCYVSDHSIFGGDLVMDNIYDIERNGYVVFCPTQALNTYFFVANENNQNLLSYKWMYNNLPKLYQFIRTHSTVNYLKTVVNMLEHVVYPEFIYLYNSLGIKKADGPWIETDEVYYVKVNDKSNIIIRYDGKIKPMFSEFDDLIMYQVQRMTPEEFSKCSVYQKDQNQGFLPNYPSTGYFNIVSLDKTNYNTDNEYKWFNNSLVFNLLPIINTKLFSKTLGHYYTVDKLLDKVLLDTYPNLSSQYLTYLRSLYSIEVTYDYDEPAWNEMTHRFDYIYNIKIELK